MAILNYKYFLFLSTPDLLLIIISALSLLLFIFPLMTILLFYHLKIFQQCLTCCKLDRSGLHALVDTYQGCFKNAATDGSERRYFAGLYLFFHFFYLLPITLPLTYLYPFFIYLIILPEILMSLLMIGIVVILRPYKRTAHNVTDFLIFFFMTLIPLLSFLEVDFNTYVTDIYQYLPFIYLYFPFRNIIYLPCLVVTIYALHKILKHSCLLCCKRSCHQLTMRDESHPPPTESRPLVTHPTATEVTLNDDFIQDDDLYADRILHPSEYNEQHVNQYQSIQDSTENQPHAPVVAHGNKSPPLHTI